MEALKDLPASLKLALDVSQKESISKAINEVISRFQKIDILVNNAGYSIRGALEGIKDGELQEIDTVILRLMLNESIKRLLDYEFIAKNQVSFDSGLKAMNNIILYGLFKRIDD